MKKLIIFTDGGARGNPGPAASGAIIKTEKGQILASIFRRLGETTNNIAEYKGVIIALEWLKTNHPFRLSEESQLPTTNYQLHFFLDSKLVVNQLNGLYKIKENHLRELVLKVRLLEQEVGGEIVYSQIPREKNWEADRLVNEALDGK